MRYSLLLFLRNVYGITLTTSIPSCRHLATIGASKNAQCNATTPALFRSSNRSKLTTIWALIVRVISYTFLGLNSQLTYALSTNPSAISHSELMRVIFGLLVVLAIILLLSWILKKLNATNLATAKGFKSLAVMSLGSKEKIMLLQVSERFLLVGVTSGSINLLHDFGEQLPNGFDSEGKSSFAALLKSVSGKS